MVDRFSGWLNIYYYPPHKAIADTPINTCQTIFINYGIPEEMSTDGIVYSYLKTLMVFIADTGAKVSVCSLEQAKKWKLTDKMFSTNTKLKPFNSDPIKVERQAVCAVTFGSNSVPVKWHIIAAECEPILVGNSATALGIIEFNHKQGIIAPINMIHTDPKGEIQSCLAEYSHNLRGVSKLKNHQIKLQSQSLHHHALFHTTSKNKYLELYKK